MPWQRAEQQKWGAPGGPHLLRDCITQQMVTYSRFSLLLPFFSPLLSPPGSRTFIILILPAPRVERREEQRHGGAPRPDTEIREDAARGRKGSLLPFCLDSGTEGSFSQYRSDARGRGCSARVPRTRISQFPLPGTQLPDKSGEGRRGFRMGYGTSASL